MSHERVYHPETCEPFDVPSSKAADLRLNHGWSSTPWRREPEPEPAVREVGRGRGRQRQEPVAPPVVEEPEAVEADESDGLSCFTPTGEIEADEEA